MRGGGRLCIRISELHPPAFGRHSVRVSIADSGVGEIFPSIFEPFVTTKGETGTGLGLWVTSEIIRKNGWSIRVRSSRKPGRSGTMFSLVILRLSHS